MTMMMKLAGAAGLVALAAASPAAAQYFGYAPYGYAQNGYNANVTNMAARQCASAVQARLNTRVGLAGILGAALGARTSGGRVLQVTQIVPRKNNVRVRGLASSGVNRGYYGPYGYGAYGAAGYAYQPDLAFNCSVDYRGYVRDVDIDRR